MQPLFKASNLGVLKRFIRSKALIAFDYDGTLAPIVPNPESAFMRRSTRWLLEYLAEIHATVRGFRARVVGGKEVVNLLPYGAPHKGIALETSIRRLAYASAIYVGDDESDEDAFRLGDDSRLLTVRIGEHYASRAAFYLRGQAEVDELFQCLIHFTLDREREA